MINKRGQMTIFVIIAMVIVAGILLFFVLREQISFQVIPEEFNPVFDNYQECIELETKAAVDLIGVQGGRIYTGDYVQGSDFAPFSSHLNFLGFPIPYWFYISGNGLVKENVPSKNEMEAEIERYVEENLNENCNFDEYYSGGFWVELSNPSANVEILDDLIRVNVDSNLVVQRGDESVRKTDYEIEMQSKLGKNYKIAKEIYNYQMENLFLEGYTIDVMRLYSPVDGVEIDCSPQTWLVGDIIDELKQGIEANIGALKMQGDYYNLQSKESEYFIVPVNVDEEVRMLYSSSWPTKVEISGDGVEEEIIVAEPVGTQAGMGIMGFCYVPYHFVYDISYPVLVQIGDGLEVFQFPIAVIIDNNLPRDSDVASVIEIETEEEDNICEFKTEDVSIRVFDNELNVVDNAEINYICFDKKCRIGETENGEFDGMMPSCYNGYLQVRAEGYEDKLQLFSSNEESFVDIILDKKFEVEIEAKVGNNLLQEGEMAIVSFAKRDEDVGVTATLPGFSNIELSEGFYNVSVYVYGDTGITFPASRETKCFEVPKEGILGFFGAIQEECVEIEIPETKIEYALIGGGEGEVYLLKDELEKGKAVVEVNRLSKPNSIEELQNNFVAFESMRVNVNFENE